MEERDFAYALQLIRQGEKVQREGWNGKGMFVYLVPGSQIEVNQPPLLGIYTGGVKIKYSPRIDLHTADGYVVPWVPSQTDILANDWMLAI